MSEGNTSAAEPDAALRDAIGELIDGFNASSVGEQIGEHASRTVFDGSDRMDDDLASETKQAACSNVSAILTGLAAGRPAEEAAIPPETLEWATSLAHRGVSKAAIPRCYVVGQAIMDASLRQGLADLDLPFDVKWDLAGQLSGYLFGYVEKVCGDVVEQYQLERDSWLRRSDSVRMDLVRSILEGSGTDLAAAGRQLGYELDRAHIALLVWGDPREEAPGPGAMRAAATKLAHELGGRETLVLEAGQSIAWAWTSGPEISDRLFEPLVVDRGLLASVGSLGHGAEGFVTSHREARDARRMAGLLARPAGSVVRYRSVALSSLLSSVPGPAARFVATELGPLCVETDTNRRLRATLQIFFEEGMSWQKAARRLGLHQNTVMYRVRNAEKLLGRPLTDRRLELEVALRMADAHAALRDANPPGDSR